MAEPRRIKIRPNSEVARLLEKTKEDVLLLEKDGITYRLRKETSGTSRRKKSEADYRAFVSAAGSWKNVDIDKFMADVSESRNLSTRPPVKL